MSDITLRYVDRLVPIPLIAISVQDGFCHCGCGERPRIAQANNTAWGHVKGRPRRYVNGHQRRIASAAVSVEDRGHETPCWVWQRAVNDGGYGVFGKALAHRGIYETAIGPIPKGLVLDHLCRVRTCVNPNHLEVVTRGENVLRGETLTATNKAKTFCVNGHEYTPENTSITVQGSRQCVICRRQNWRDAYARRKEAA